MPTLDAQNRFRNGLMAMVDGRHAEAAEQFRDAMLVEKARGSPQSQIRCLSYYGLNLALAHGPNHEWLEICQEAVRRNPFDADLRLNLGRALTLAGRRTRALDEFERGLELVPAHKALLTERAKLDRRSRPVLPFLNRAHPLNLALGRFKASIVSGFSAIHKPRTDDSPASL